MRFYGMSSLNIFKNNKKGKKVPYLSRISLKKRLIIAFLLATFFPGAIVFYYITNSYQISSFVLITLGFIVVMGWWLVFGLIVSIMKIQSHAQAAVVKIPQRHLLQNLDIRNEVDNINSLFNILSTQFQENIEKLKVVNIHTAELNQTIAKKIKIFSSAIQANTLCSKGMPAADIIQLLAKDLKEIIQADVIIAFLKGDSNDYIQFSCGSEQKLIDIFSIQNIKDITDLNNRYVVDFQHKDDDFPFINDELKLKNFLINPIRFKEQDIGFVLIGNHKDNFVFSNDDYDIASFFSYNIGVVRERQHLYKAVNDLKIIDSVMGIYNKKFFFNRLDEEIKRSALYQRPCGLLVINIANYTDYRQKLGFEQWDRVLKQLVRVCKENLRPIDILGRLNDNRIGIILTECSKRRSRYFGTKIKEVIYNFLEEATDFAAQISFAVAENPIDGASANQLSENIQKQFNGQ